MAVYCPRCNTANREGSRYCNNCGSQLEAPATAVCPNCKSPIIAYSGYCHHCGARLPAPDMPAVTPPEPITETDEEQGEQAEESEIISLDEVPATPAVSRAVAAAAQAEEAIPETAEAMEAVAPRSEPVQPAEMPAVTAAAEPAPPEEAPAIAADLEPAVPDEAPVVAADLEPTLSEQPASIEAESSERLRTPSEKPAPVEVTASRLLPIRVRPSAARRRASAQATPVPARDRTDMWRRLSYLTLAAAVIIGLFLPAGSLGSTPAMPEVQSLYQSIQNLPLRSTVLVSFDYDTATADEMRPLAQAVIHHLMQRQARILVMSLLPQGPALAQAAIQPLAEQYIYAYGADYVNFGYLSGGEAALAALGTSLPQAFAIDFVQGQPLSQFSATRDVAGVTSVALIVELAGDEAGVGRWVEQVQGRYPIHLVAATTALAMPLAFPYLQSGQVSGLASGLPAAAQYERLLGYNGQATRTADALSLGQLAILLFIILANLGLIVRWRRT